MLAGKAIVTAYIVLLSVVAWRTLRVQRRHAVELAAARDLWSGLAT
jgi:hypothetical protein